MEEVKVCTTCGEEKPLSQFNKDKKNKDGHVYKCKACCKDYKAKHYLDNQEEIKAKSAKWHLENPREKKPSKFEVTKGTFLEDVRRIHTGTIEVLGEYLGTQQPIACKCSTCGRLWESTPNSLKAGKGCLECARSKPKAITIATAATFTEDIKLVHGDKIELLSEYVRSNQKVNCKCTKCSHTWAVTPMSLKQGQGCPVCAREHTDISKRTHATNDRPTTVYYVYFPELNLWKVGCTVNSIAKRFNRDPLIEYKVLWEKTYSTGQEAYLVESWLLKHSKDDSIPTNTKPLASNGNTELRSRPLVKLALLVRMAEVAYNITVINPKLKEMNNESNL